MAGTNIGYGAPGAMVEQAAGVFAAHMQRPSTMRYLTGAMPKGTAGAANTVRKQTKAEMPIVRCQDLGKGKGDEITFHLLNPVGAYPIMGSEYAEGKGTAMSYSEAKLRVDQSRFPVDLGNVMTGIRSPVDFRMMGRPVAQSLMDAYIDQSLLVHMAGARGYHDNIEWRVPVASHAKFGNVMVNAVKAPTKNRHFMVDGGNGIKEFGVSSGAVDLATTDLVKMDTLDAVRLMLESIALPPPPVVFDGDRGGMDSPLRVLLVSPAQFSGYATDPSFRTYQANALARSPDNPIFRGQDTILFNGVLIVKMPRPIRFYKGDTIKYCASHTSETESSCVVPDSFGDTHAVDRAILLGGQAIAEALAASEQGGMPFFWSEKKLDHDDKAELLIGAIRGVSKIRFAVDQGLSLIHI
jgi:N4-gp56 family major capsid protein